MDSGTWDGSVAATDNNESLSSTNDAELLKRAWRTEIAAPEILQFEAGLVQRSRDRSNSHCMKWQGLTIKHHTLKQETKGIMTQPVSQDGVVTVADWSNARHNEEIVEELMASGNDPLTLSLNQMDMDRALFLLRSYLRTRLQKIEKYMVHIHKNTELWYRLSKEEQKFAKRCVEDLEEHFEKSVLSKLPDRYKSSVKQSVISEEDDMVPEPQLDTYVICRTKRTLGAVQLDNSGIEDPVDLDPGDLYAVRYKSIKSLVYSGQVELV